MFLCKNKKNNVYPCKPQFYYIKVGFKEVRFILACFRDGLNTAYDCVTLHCTEPFIIIPSSSQYDLNNVEGDIKYQIIIIILKYEKRQYITL